MSRFATLVLCSILLAASGACGGAGATAPAPAGMAVAAGAGCAQDHHQDLTFSGAFVGHLACDAGQPICDFVFAGRKTDTAFTGAIHVLAGGKQVLFAFEVAPFAGPGTYQSVNQEGGVTITLDGPRHWQGRLGDAINVATVDQRILTGSVDSTLSSTGGADVRLTGRWMCERVSSGR